MLDMPFKWKIVFYLSVVYNEYQKEKKNIYSLCKNFQANQWRDADETISRMSRQCFISGWLITKILLHIHFGHIQIVLLVNISPASSLLRLPILYGCVSELGGGERTHKGTCTTVRTGSAMWRPQHSCFCFLGDHHRPCFLWFVFRFWRRLCTW